MRRNIYGIFFLSMRARSVKLRVCFYFFFFLLCYIIILWWPRESTNLSECAETYDIFFRVCARVQFENIGLFSSAILFHPSLKIFFSQFLRTEQSISSAGHIELSKNDFLSEGGRVYTGLLLNAQQR